MVEYSSRLQAAMDLRCVTRTQLSKALGISYVAVKKVLDGQTKAFTAENNSLAAAFLQISPDWLATGDGDMLASTNDGSVKSRLAEKQTAELTTAIEKVEVALDKIKTSVAASNLVQIDHAWPFRDITREQWASLGAQQSVVEGLIHSLLLAQQAAGGGSGFEKNQKAA